VLATAVLLLMSAESWARVLSLTPAESWMRVLARRGVQLVAPVGAWSKAPLVLPSLSPYVVVASAAALRSVTAMALFALPALLLALMWRRGFCRYACPVGLCLDVVSLLRPKARKRTPKLPPVGQWVALVSLGSAAVGGPLFVWLDPLVLFHGSVASWTQPSVRAAAVMGAGLPVLALLALAVPNLWCGRLCPLGGTQELLRDVVLALRRRREGTPNSHGAAVARRAVFGAGLGAICALALPRRTQAALLRPPGAVDDAHFADLCVGCGNCVRACPAGIIEPNLDFARARGFLTPMLNFENDYCREDCTACTHVCPTGAIRELTLEGKRNTPIGLAVVDRDLCVLSDESQWQDCAACQMACPYTAVEIAFDEDTYRSSVIIHPELCVGCGACPPRCPANPKSAIVIRPAGQTT
jgi:ferredoxin